MANEVTWPTLNEANDERVLVTLTTNQPTAGTVLDLTGKTVEAYLKTAAATSDADPTTWKGSSADATPAVTITDAAGGKCEVKIPAAALTTAKTWLRVDVLTSGERKTGPFGAVTVRDL